MSVIGTVLTKPDINKRVEQYVKLRDVIKDLDDVHKTNMAPYHDTLEQLNGALLTHLQGQNAESIRTEAGTVYATDKKTASIADATAFWTYVVATGEWDLLDKRANVTAVEDFIKKNNTPPPGVNFNTIKKVGVRRA